MRCLKLGVVVAGVCLAACTGLFSANEGQGSPQKGPIPLPGGTAGTTGGTSTGGTTTGGSTGSTAGGTVVSSVATASSGSMPANGSSAVTLVITDGNTTTGAAEANTPLTLQVTGGVGYVSGDLLTNASGQATVYLASTSTSTLTANVYETGTGILVGSKGVTFTAANYGVSTFTVSPTTCIADGNCQIALVVSAQDTGGNPLAGVAVAFQVSDTNNVVHAGTKTGVGGKLVGELTSTHAATKTITANLTYGTSQPSLSATVTFVSGSATPCPNGVVLGGRAAYFASPQAGLAAAADFNGDHYSDVATSWAANGNVFVAFGSNTGALGVPIAVNAQGTVALATDLTGDGNADLLVTGSNSNVTVYPNTGGGTFGPGVVSTTVVSSVPTQMAAGLINGDSLTDVVFAVNGTAHVMTGTGGGALSPSSSVSLCMGATALTLADMDGDTVPDLVAGCASGGVVVARNTGTGTFGTPVTTATPTASAMTALTVQDLNGDNIPDVAAIAGGTLYMFLGESGGAGALATPTVIGSGVTAAGAPAALAAGLFASNNNDLLVVTNGRSVLFVAIGGGTFRVPVSTTNSLASSAVPAVAVGNFDTNTELDALISSASGGSAVSLWLDPTYTVAQSYGIGGAPLNANAGAMLKEDLNDDGFSDLLLLGSGTTSLLDNGDGTFFQQVAWGFSTNTAGALGLFDADPYVDLALASGDVLLGNGDGTFTLLGTFAVAANGTAILTADYNGDQNADLVVPVPSQPAAYVYLGQGGGSFGAGIAATLPAASVIFAAHDFDNDGNQDLLALTPSGTAYFLAGNGNGNLATPVGASATLPANPVALAVGDFNNDAVADIAVLGAYGALQVGLGNGTGNFTNAAALTMPATVVSGGAVTADVNQDGNLDLIAGIGAVTLYLGNGDGTFAAPAVYAPGAVQKLRAADFNGDGWPDLAYELGGNPGMLINGGCY